MTVSFLELNESGAVEITDQGWTVTYRYHADESDPETAAGAATAIGTAHPTISGIAVTNIKATPIDNQGCIVEITYGGDESDRLENEYGEIYEWDLATSQVHITNVATSGDQDHYPAGSSAVGTAIGVDGDDVQGVDVYRPEMSLKITKRVSVEPSATYRNTVIGLLAKTNNSPFAGMSTGEVLFIGSAIRKVEPAKWEIEFNFLVAKSAGTTSYTSVSGGTITTRTPGAWEYVWFRHAQKKVTGTLTSGVQSVHIATVYGSGAFSGLQIGQAFSNP